MICLFVLSIFISHLIHVNYGLEYLQKSNLFCTDSMLETGFTHIILNSTLPLFGKNKWFSIENLTNFTKLYKLKGIHSHECFNKTIERFDDCWNSIRKKWIGYLIPVENINDRLIIEKIEQNQSNKTSKITNNIIYFKFLNALCLTACYSRYKENLEPIIKSHIVCPFPCILQNDCSFELCKNYGVFTHEYECPCNDSYKWDRDSNECLPESIYKIRQTSEYPDFIAKEKMLRLRKVRNCEHNSVCNKNGTLFCTLDSNYEYTKCVCKLDYHGRYCQDKINACLYRVQHHLQPNGGTLVAGNTACNINNNSGNKCISLISAEGDATYRCQCNETHWKPNIRLPYANCMQKVTRCSSIICLHGFCTTNNFSDQAKCVCDPGYGGIACDEWVGEWSEWSEWDKCRPNCGNIRYSVRERECLSMRLGNKSKQCLGSSVEYTKCVENLCKYKGMPYSYVCSLVHQNFVAISFTFGAAICDTIIVIWIFLFSILIRSLCILLQKLYLQRQQTRIRGKVNKVILKQYGSEMSIDNIEGMNNVVKEDSELNTSDTND
ncbi:hypothetical protein MN116_003735 [Schistosoma mekongi]|uniref:EGF-like domain-containing protein n=1 Tax=Schistosoma mekongi TaxID=38744 RepID=A0AAE1ZER7_SCHME|nr:hypothetical protein MN116_003735 [Schistosoma mekongi]